jgi:hypothetical protein
MAVTRLLMPAAGLQNDPRPLSLALESDVATLPSEPYNPNASSRIAIMPATESAPLIFSKRLPKRLRQFFWDCRWSDVDPHRHAEFIAYRVLTDGDWPAIQWLRKTAGDATLCALVRRRRGRGLSRQQLRFWQAMWHLPRREVDAWLADRIDDTWDRRTDEA